MSAFCANRTVHSDLIEATHLVESPLHRPGVWHVLAVTYTPGNRFKPPEFCLGCAQTVAARRMQAWQHAQEQAHASA